MNDYSFENNLANISPAIDFTCQALEECGIMIRNPKEDFHFLSELLKYLAKEHTMTKEIRISVSKRFGDTNIQIFFDGDKLDIDRLLDEAVMMSSGGGLDPIEAGRIKELFTNHFQSKNFHCKYNNNVNTLTFVIHRMAHKDLLILMAALFAGISFGIAARTFLPASAVGILSRDILLSVSDVFIKCIKMLIAPLIFFTISSSISSYTDLSSLGRMGRKISVRYVLNAFLGLAVSIALTMAIRPGVGSTISNIDAILGGAHDIVDTASNTSISLKDTILNIFPSNFFKAFVDSSILQIIFISFLLGIATTTIAGDYREKICGFLNAGNEVFTKMTSILMVFLPISVFCSMANAMITMGSDTLLMIVKWLIVLIIAFAAMTIIYVLLIWQSTSIKPSLYFKNYSEAIIATFAMGSCNSSMPLCMKASEENLGVQKQVSSFSIPIGVSLHCASNCVFYTISLFFLVNLYSNVSISPMNNLMIFFSIFLLGIGAPSVSGAGPICVAVLLSQMNTPMGLISLIIGLDPFVSMFKSACSCIEDSYVMLALAKSEDQIDFTAIK